MSRSTIIGVLAAAAVATACSQRSAVPVTAAASGGWNCVIVIAVDGDKTPQPAPGRCPPDRRLLVVVQNFTGVDYSVSIDPDADFVIKSNKSAAKPLASGKGSANVKAGDADVMKFKLKQASDFGGASLPYTTYKYVVHIAWKEGGVDKRYDLDPDLDVPPS